MLLHAIFQSNDADGAKVRGSGAAHWSVANTPCPDRLYGDAAPPGPRSGQGVDVGRRCINL